MVRPRHLHRYELFMFFSPLSKISHPISPQFPTHGLIALLPSCPVDLVQLWMDLCFFSKSTVSKLESFPSRKGLPISVPLAEDSVRSCTCESFILLSPRTSKLFSLLRLEVCWWCRHCTSKTYCAWQWLSIFWDFGKYSVHNPVIKFSLSNTLNKQLLKPLVIIDKRRGSLQPAVRNRQKLPNVSKVLCELIFIVVSSPVEPLGRVRSYFHRVVHLPSTLRTFQSWTWISGAVGRSP